MIERRNLLKAYGAGLVLTPPNAEGMKGAIIALSGNSGRSTGPHIHYEVLPNGRSFEVAEVAETAEQPSIPNGDLRHQQEQRMEEAVNSTLRKIKRSSGPSGNVGQEG